MTIAAEGAPQVIAGSEFIVDADMVISAIGQSPDLSYLNGDGIKITKSNTVEVDRKTLATAKEGFYAAGDNVRGPASVVEAVADGKNAAMAIDVYLGGDGLAMNAFRDELVKMIVSYDETEYQKERKDQRCSTYLLLRDTGILTRLSLATRLSCSRGGQTMSALLSQRRRIISRRRIRSVAL